VVCFRDTSSQLTETNHSTSSHDNSPAALKTKNIRPEYNAGLGYSNAAATLQGVCSISLGMSGVGA
jgi:hypothetical protein